MKKIIFMSMVLVVWVPLTTVAMFINDTETVTMPVTGTVDLSVNENVQAGSYIDTADNFVVKSILSAILDKQESSSLVDVTSPAFISLVAEGPTLSDLFDGILSREGSDWQLDPIVSSLSENRYVTSELLNDLVRVAIEEIRESSFLFYSGTYLPLSLFNMEDTSITEISRDIAFSINNRNPLIAEGVVYSGKPYRLLGQMEDKNVEDFRTMYYTMEGYSKEKASDVGVIAGVKLGGTEFKVKIIVDTNYWNEYKGNEQYRVKMFIEGGNEFGEEMSVEEFFNIWDGTIYCGSVTSYGLDKISMDSKLAGTMDTFDQLDTFFGLQQDEYGKGVAASNVAVGVNLGGISYIVKVDIYTNYYYKNPDRVRIGGIMDDISQEMSVEEFEQIWDGTVYLIED